MNMSATASTWSGRLEFKSPNSAIIWRTLRAQVLATEQERRGSVLPDMIQIMQLEERNHANIVENEPPSRADTFQQLAQVLATGDVATYRPSKAPNPDWRNWPEGGSL
jgi:hypothetical protein